MTHDDIEGDPGAAAVRHLNDLRQAFWDCVKAQDPTGAQRIQREVHEYWRHITGDLKDDPAVAAAWSAALQDVALRPGLMDDGETRPDIWEAKAQIDQLGERLQTLLGRVNPREQPRASLGGAAAVAEELTAFYAQTTSELGIRLAAILVAE